MFDAVLSIIAPHRCYGCQKTGSVLCSVCKKHIMKQRYVGCVLCGGRAGVDNCCKRHRFPAQRTHCLLAREGVASSVIDALKFQRTQAAAAVLAELTDELLPELPPNSVIVPVPTTPRNIRRRGYDHMRLICRQLSRRRRLPLRALLRRRNNIVQHFATTAKQRRSQAKMFFKSVGRIDPETTYIVVDDIFTTGATLAEAVRCLKRAGATSVVAVAITRHGTPGE